MFDSSILTAGIYSSLINNNDQNLYYLMDCKNNYNIHLENRHINIIFNCATKHKKTDLCDQLEKEYAVTKKSLSKDGIIDMDQNGLVSKRAVFSDLYPIVTTYEEKLYDFSYNPFKYNVLNKNWNMIEKMLDTNANKINPTLVEESFVMECVHGQTESVLYLISNEITRKIIKNSEAVKLFLNEPTEYMEIKEQLNKALFMLELDQELPKEISNNKSKIKL